MTEEVQSLRRRLEHLTRFFEEASKSEELLLAGARNLAWSMGEIFICASAMKTLGPQGEVLSPGEAKFWRIFG